MEAPKQKAFSFTSKDGRKVYFPIINLIRLYRANIRNSLTNMCAFEDWLFNFEYDETWLEKDVETFNRQNFMDLCEEFDELQYVSQIYSGDITIKNLDLLQKYKKVCTEFDCDKVIEFYQKERSELRKRVRR